jgi:hypothetical protein
VHPGSSGPSGGQEVLQDRVRGTFTDPTLFPVSKADPPPLSLRVGVIRVDLLAVVGGGSEADQDSLIRLDGPRPTPFLDQPAAHQAHEASRLGIWAFEGNNLLDSVGGRRFALGPRKHVWLGGLKVRLHDDVRKLIVFLGFRTMGQSGESVPRFGGTGFFVSYPGPGQPNLRIPYLITARHVAEELVGPFVIGVNDSLGDLRLCDIDEAVWHYHPDQDVDVAATPMGFVEGADWLQFPYEAFADNEDSSVGVGDLVYIVGLYRLFPGRAKISPVVHTGHVAMAPDEEIPVWNRRTGQITGTRGYLIEAQTLEGLSGSPVFIRHTNPIDIRTEFGKAVAYTETVYLLGLWQGAWDGVAGDTLTQEFGKQSVRVPVGMGITIPCRRIAEVLQLPDLQTGRERVVDRHLAADAAKTD